MRLYDENGQYVGGVLDAEYERTKDSIMPVAIEVQVPKYNAPVSGYTVMFIGSLVSVICLFLSLILSGHMAENAEGIRGILYQIGVFFHFKAFVIPVVMFVQLAASILLIRENKLFLAAFVVRVLSVILILAPIKDYHSKFLPYPAIIDFCALVVTAMAFAVKAEAKNGKLRCYIKSALLCIVKLSALCGAAYVWLKDDEGAVIMAYVILFLCSCFETAVWYSFMKGIKDKGEINESIR